MERRCRKAFAAHFPALVCFVLVIGISAFAHSAERPKGGYGKFTITCLEMPDVGRGAGLAVVLQTPGGHTYLYDTGVGYPVTTNASGWETGFNAGKDMIAPFLAKNHIKQIDGIMISHAHLDHYGGLLWLADHYRVKKLYDSGYEFPFPKQLSPAWQGELGGYDKLRARFKEQGAYQEVHTGDKIPLDPLLDVEVIAPPKKFFGDAHPEQRQGWNPAPHYLLNANSLEVRIRHGNVVFLFTGDIGKQDWVESLLPSVAPAKLRADILIAPGHGLDQSSAMANTVRPKVVIASVFTRWADHTNVQAIYGKVGAKVYITGIRGTVTVASDGENYTVNTER